MNLGSFGLDSMTLSGPLEEKLCVTKAAGFSHIMLRAKELAEHPNGLDAAIRLVQRSGLRVAGLQTMRDYEGLEGSLHDYKIDVAKNLLRICREVKAPLLIVRSSTLEHANGETAIIACHLSKLANLAVPLGVRIGYEALPWGRHINNYALAWQVISRADHANLGLVIDSAHLLANDPAHNDIDAFPARKIALVQLSDYIQKCLHGQSKSAKIKDERYVHVFPGEGEYLAELSELVRRLYRAGYRGDYSFGVFNEDYLQMPPEIVVQHAHQAAKWVTDQVLRRSLQVRSSVNTNAI